MNYGYQQRSNSRNTTRHMIFVALPTETAYLYLRYLPQMKIERQKSLFCGGVVTFMTLVGKSKTMPAKRKCPFLQRTPGIQPEALKYNNQKTKCAANSGSRDQRLEHLQSIANNNASTAIMIPTLGLATLYLQEMIILNIPLEFLLKIGSQRLSPSSCGPCSFLPQGDRLGAAETWTHTFHGGRTKVNRQPLTSNLPLLW